MNCIVAPHTSEFLPHDNKAYVASSESYEIDSEKIYSTELPIYLQCLEKNRAKSNKNYQCLDTVTDVNKEREEEEKEKKRKKKKKEKKKKKMKRKKERGRRVAPRIP